MPTNDFLPFATAGGANVLSQSDYDAAAARSAGVIAGTASSALANKSWRQSSIMAAVLGQFIGDYGALDALDDGDVADLVRDFARSIQRGTFAYVVATGTANAWTVAPTPAVAAYAAGRVLNIIAPATNTSTTVNVNISTLGNRRIKRADGTDPGVGDLVSGRVYATIDDGTSIRILTPLKSDILRDASIVGRTQLFTSSGTFTVPDGVTSVEVEGWSGGGAGGASNNSTAGATLVGNPGAGGGAGAYFYKRITGLTPGATETVTVGAGGAGGAGAGGGMGGTSSFGSHASATGGLGGSFGSSTVANGGAGGTATGGDLNIAGGQGGASGTNSGTVIPSNLYIVFARGGMPPRGIGTIDFCNTGSAGSGFASGGAGASGGSGLAGGNGAPGLVIVRW